MKINHKKSRKALLLLAFLVLTVGFTVIAITVTVMNNSKNQKSSAQLIGNGSAISGAYHGKSSAELLKELKKKQINVTDKFSSQIMFQSGKRGSTGSWIVENSAANKVTEQCSVNLKGQTVAVSAPIKAGQHIENITLNTPVNSGTYDVTVSVNYYDPASSAHLGQADYQNVKMVVS